MTNTALSTQAMPGAVRTSSGAIRNGLLEAMTPKTIEDTFRLAKALSQSGDMIPKHFQGKPEAVMAALLQGASIGMPPMQSLQYIAVINGRPSVWGDALPALVMAAGHFVDTDLSGEGDKMIATATLTRKDGKKVVRTFSMADAKKAGLAGKPGPWQQYPSRMLQMRARAWAVRDGAPDALVGLAIAEEVQDYGPDAARDVTPRQAPRPGRAMYIDPDPVVDEIHEAEPESLSLPAPERAMFEDLARTIIADAGETSPIEVRSMYADQIELMKVHFPDLHEAVEGAIMGAGQ